MVPKQKSSRRPSAASAASSSSASKLHSFSTEQLLQDLQSDNVFFDQLVDMIPAKLYVAGHSGDDYNPKYFKGQAKESKEARRAQNKHAKRSKLDPNVSESTTQVKKRLDQDRDSNSRPLLPQAAPEVEAAATAAAATTVMKETPPPPSPDTTDNNNDNEDNNSNPNQSRIEALREKLHAKLAEKRGQRPTDPNVVSKRAARRAEKKKRQEEAAKRKKSAHTQAEKDNNSKSKQFKMAVNNPNDPAADLATLDFGRLAGLNVSTKGGNYQKANKSLANMGKSKNLQKLLADAETKKQRLEDLKSSDKEQDKTKFANIQWGDAIKEATGERVKDDPAKLKKALKRQAAKKTKSAKAWKSRTETIKQNTDQRQKIRQHNLTKRKEGGSTAANLSSKRIATDEDKKDTKKPRSRAGFEGRKQEFLNKNKGQ